MKAFQLPQHPSGPWNSPYFEHGICGYQAARLTVRELAMLNLMNAITDKTGWHEKVHDQAIVYKWREEAQLLPDGMISDKAFDWCIKELRDKSKQFEENKFVRVLDSEAKCVKSDLLISEQLANDLKRAVRPLLAVGDNEKDWHPNSDSKVLNLVHPSLYPLVNGRSRFLASGNIGLENCFEFMGEGTLTPPGEEIPSSAEEHGRSDWRTQENLCSTRFQWLPSEIRFVGDEGAEVKFTSYINNLHPVRHKELYRVIERMIEKSVPLWNDVLLEGGIDNHGLRIKTNVGLSEPPQVPYADQLGKYEDNLSPLAPQIREYIAQPDNPLFADRLGKRQEYLPDDPMDWDVDAVSQALEETFYRTRTIIHPEPGESVSYEQWRSGCSKHCIEDEFRKQGLQVIVKLSSIELTPENPEYPGGSWHLEGMLNENIVATSIYYYDVDNVTESRIRFSQEAALYKLDLEYEQDDHDPLAITFGTESMRDEPAVQEIGSIATRHGRIIAFPNTLRHKVEPFSLADRTKPGHRRYLVLWLVDPHDRIVSTANVPPQQLSWAEDARVAFNNRARLMTLEEAKAYRLALMAERTAFNKAVEDNFDTYNLCEH